MTLGEKKLQGGGGGDEFNAQYIPLKVREMLSP